MSMAGRSFALILEMTTRKVAAPAAPELGDAMAAAAAAAAAAG